MDPTPARRPWWAVPLVVLVLLVLLAVLFGQPPRAPAPGGSGDASPNGVRAAFLLLQGLGYDVAASRRLGAGRVRWVLFPRKGLNELPALERWVRAGGVLVLADDNPEVADRLGVGATVASDAGTAVLWVGGERLVVSGGTRLTPRRPPARTWPAQGEPLADVFGLGRGEVWLVRRPEVVRNDRLRDHDNAVAVCRLADATGAGRERIYFDEYFHGLRERPGPVELLLEPPALWVTLQGAALLALALWRSLPRPGAAREPPAERRRSKEEFLDAMAGLLERKRAFIDGHQTARDALARELEDALGLPAGTPPDVLADQAARRRPGLGAGRLARALAPDRPPRGAAEFLRALNEIETLQDQFFDARNHR